MKIKKILGGLKFKLTHRKEKFEIGTLNGKVVRLAKGTLRKEQDVDDVWFSCLAANSNKIFDVGCNVGYTSILALTHDNVEKILMLDPNPEALILANKNVLYNNYIHKTQSFLGFVSDVIDEELDFYTIGHGAAGSIYKSHAETASAIGSFMKVKTVTLDFLVNYFKWIPDFIKIDVEGAEVLVLEGMIRVAQENKIKILVEMHSNQEMTMKENADKVLEWCKKTDYNAWYMSTKNMLNDSEIVKHRGRCHLLLLPDSEVFPQYLL